MKKHILGDYNMIEPLECVDIVVTACSLSNIGRGKGKKTFLYKFQLVYNYSYNVHNI